MAVRIRLTRVGATKRPSYRVVAIEKQRARDGRALEILGFYDPLTDPATVKLDADRIQAWISKGAQPSDTVVKLMRQAENGPVNPKAETAKPAARARKPKQTAAVAAEPATEKPTQAETAQAESEEAAPAPAEVAAEVGDQPAAAGAEAEAEAKA